MAYDRQTRLKAIEFYLDCHNVSEVARRMDGPSRSCDENWVAAAIGVKKRSLLTKSFTVDDKVGAVMRVRAGEVAPSVAKDIGVSPGAVYHWVDCYEKLGAVGLMGKQDEQEHPRVPQEDLNEPPAIGELEQLRKKCADMEFELDLLKGVVDIVKI